MNNLITPRWMDLESAVAYLFDKTGKQWNISNLLELGSLGKLPLYAVVPDDSWIQCWDISSNNPVMRQVEMVHPLHLSLHQIQKMQIYYPGHGYEILVEYQLPVGCSYDLPEFYPILMRMASKDFSRGVVISSHKALRISGPELAAFMAETQSSKVVVGSESGANKIQNRDSYTKRAFKEFKAEKILHKTFEACANLHGVTRQAYSKAYREAESKSKWGTSK